MNNVAPFRRRASRADIPSGTKHLGSTGCCVACNATRTTIPPPPGRRFPFRLLFRVGLYGAIGAGFLLLSFGPHSLFPHAGITSAIAVSVLLVLDWRSR